MRMKKLIAAALATIFAPQALFAAGYEFEGVGARQVARGGAVIADSADWTSIYWNAANIAGSSKQNGPELGVEIFGGQAFGKDSNSLSSLPGVGPFDKDKLDSHFILGAVGFVLPVSEKIGIGFGVYTPLLQGADFSDASNSTPQQNLDFEASAGIVTTALGIGYQITPAFSVGTGVNLLYGHLESDITSSNTILAGNTATDKRDASGMGLEGVLGLGYKPNDKWAFGASYRSGSDVVLHGSEKVTNTSALLPDEDNNFRYELRHPPTAGAGVAFRPNDKWTLSFDVNRTFWGRFSSEVQYDQQKLILFNKGNSFDWRNTWKVRWGAQVQATQKSQFMFGYAFDEPALDAASVDFATSVDVYMHRLSTGWAYRRNERHEIVVGLLGGYGDRDEGRVHYRLSGWQLMLESRWTPRRAS